ncbi:hypothetical protein OJAV_G00211450, partial [Oryzias javanicus]
RAWEDVFADCQRIQAVSAREPLTRVARLACRSPVTVPANSEVILWAKTAPWPCGSKVSAMVEPLNEGGNVEIARTLVTVDHGRLPMRVRNLNPFPVVMSRFQKLANVCSVNPEDIRGCKEVSLCEVSPGVVEVAVIDVGESLRGVGGENQPLCPLGEDLTDEQQQQLGQVLRKWGHVFARHDDDYGHTNVVKHRIPTGSAEPIKERYRPVPPTLYKEIRSLLHNMLEQGVIRESSSPWAAPIVLVTKERWSLEVLRVYYRKLNRVTHKDAFPLPRIEDSLTTLTQAEWYSTLDLASGYWQVEVEEKDREKTAFTTPFGLFEFERMPFGLCNAPATFQRLMQRCLGDQLIDSAPRVPGICYCVL